MNKYSNYKKIFALMNTFLTYLFSACVIFNMNTVWMHCPQSVIVKEILLIILGSSIIVGVLLNLRNNARKILYAIITISLISLYFVVFKYLNKQTLMSDFYYYWISIIFIVLYVLFVEKSMKDTMKKMDDVILLIAIISLLFWLFGSVMHLVHPNGSVFSYWTDADAPSYYNLYFETQRGAFFGFDNVIIRNTAIFTEAPMSSLVFSTAFISELFLVKSKQICRHVILLIAIITTFSTSGYSVVVLAIAIIAMMKIFGSQNIKLKKAVKKIGVLFIFVSIIAFIFSL